MPTAETLIVPRVAGLPIRNGRHQPALRSALGGLVVLIGFSIPLSTSLAEIATTLFVVLWLCAVDLSAAWRVVRSAPVAQLSLGLFVLLAAAMCYSSATWAAAGRCLLKYRELIYLPMLLVVFQDAALRRKALRALVAGSAVVVGLSYFEWLTGVDLAQPSAPNDFIIGKDRIIQSLILALVAYVSALVIAAPHDAHGEKLCFARWFHALLLPLAVGNVLFLVQGRTGYLLLAALTALFMYQQLGLRGLAAAGLLIAAGGWGAYQFSSPLRARVEFTMTQLTRHFGPQPEPWWDPRLEFYENTLTLIGRHPLIGTGTGSFPVEYARLSQEGKSLKPTTDPHNEYLHLAVQAGLAGPVLFLSMLGFQWFLARRSGKFDQGLGRGIVVVIALGSLFNSLILSVTGGLIYSFLSAMALASLVEVRGASTEAAEDVAHGLKRAA
jgi:O-antigen ligase